MVPARELDELNRAWRAMNRSVEESTVSHFYKVRQQALDAAMPERSGRSVGDASGPFRRLFGFLSGDRDTASDDYKGDIASVSRAQDASFGRQSHEHPGAAEKR